MITTSSAISRASSWSWVTKIVVSWISSWKRRSQRRRSLRTRASRAPKGSSRSSTLGSTASARARATRWRSPPESCEGKRPARPSSCTSSSRRWTRSAIAGGRRPVAAAAHPQAEGDVLEDRHVPEEGVVLEDEAHLALARGHVRHVVAVEEHPAAARVGELEAGDDPQERRLARARGAEERHELALGHVQVDAVEGGVRPELLADAVGLDAHGAVAVCRHSTTDLTTRVPSARSARSEATAKAPTMLYSL